MKALADPNSKNDFFRKGAPKDDKLHFIWRSQEFFRRLAEVLGRAVDIPDEIVDTESNLWPIVLKKNLFRLGFDHECLSAHDGTIHNLVNRRNNIAHGLERSGISEGDFDKLQKAVYEVMDEVMSMVMTSLSKQSFLRPVPSGGQTSEAQPANRD